MNPDDNLYLPRHLSREAANTLWSACPLQFQPLPIRPDGEVASLAQEQMTGDQFAAFMDAQER